MSDGRLVLGLDPGLATLGYGLIRATPNSMDYVGHGCITTRAGALSERLHLLFSELSALRQQFPINDVAMESTFYANRLSAQRIGEARGVAILAAATDGIGLFEYSPTQVKQAVTGSGTAGKRQVQEMVRMILGLSVVPTPDDAADALAVAMCHARTLELERIVAGAVGGGGGVS